MIKKILITIAAFSFLKINSQTMTSVPVTVKNVDLKKYSGTWYEIAKIPNKFQKKCAGNTSTYYSVEEDGTLKVINKCKKEDGDYTDLEGVAKIPDKNDNAKLRVSFFSVLGIRPFWGDYWIIGLDNDYNWAIIGTPEREFGWILSRTKTLDDKTRSQIDDILRKQGYNTKDFINTKQD